MKKLDKAVNHFYEELARYVGRGADKGFNVTCYHSQDQYSEGYAVGVNDNGKVTIHQFETKATALNYYHSIVG